MTLPPPTAAAFPLAPTPLGAGRPCAAHAELTEIDGRTVSYFCLDGRRGNLSGAVEAEVVTRALDLAGQLGCPVVGLVHSISVDPESGLSGLDAWGRVAARIVRLSGVVPLIFAVTGPVHGSLAMLLGLVDHVILTLDATAYVSGPDSVLATTDLRVDPADLGGSAVHSARSGLATLLAVDPRDAIGAVADLLSYLPDNNLADPPFGRCLDMIDRHCSAAAAVVPRDPACAYDVRQVLSDVFDTDTLLEVHANHAANVVCAYARLGGRAVAIVANQPNVRAGTLDIDASCKAARHVRGADAFGLPIFTFIDTPGYEPGRDLEHRGIIRHGAKLAHAYGAATVPRLGVILRKAYGGAYIAMDSRAMGNDLTLAWPNSEIAVMGAPGAVAILNRRELEQAADPDGTRSELEATYRSKFCTPRLASERGLIDQVIEPVDTRRILASALGRLAIKRPSLVARRHANEPL
ncbi:MAG: carboxyl transferase domain-containing protein [Aquihabitans sp.]